jgi:membrane fusion protein (multidrug efflux system)
MSFTLKSAAWIGAAVVAVGLIAAPKLMPPKQAAKSPDASQSGKRSQADGAKSGAALAVSAIVVERGPFAELVTSTGTMRAEESVELQAEINGKVVAINFTEGAHVKAGELLVKLNDADLRATRERAVQRKKLAKLREQRLAQLVKQGVARQEEYDTAFSELQVQNSEIELADAQIAKTEVRAPFSGVVGLRYVSTGAFVNAATRVATLQRLDRLKIDFSIPEKYAGRIKLGSAIEFSVAGGNRKYNGEIYAFDPRIDTSTRTVLLRAICSNEDNMLLPGAFANVALTLSKMDDAILIPSEAVIPGLTEKNVFLIANGKALRRAVETGTRTESRVQILAGLKPGDVVITSGLQQMRDGLPVIAGEQRNFKPRTEAASLPNKTSALAGAAPQNRPLVAHKT